MHNTIKNSLKKRPDSSFNLKLFNTDVATHHESVKSSSDKRRSTMFANGLILSSFTLKKQQTTSDTLITNIDRSFKKEALQIPLLISKYLGATKTKKTPNEIAVLLINLAVCIPSLRDEVYMQLCKNTTSAHKRIELEKAWELFCICLSFFRPSQKVETFIEGYFSQHVIETNETSDSCAIYADKCYQILEIYADNDRHRLPLIINRKISLESVILTRERIYYPQKFNVEIRVLMRSQRRKYPDINIPFFIPLICECIIRYHGLITEGIFRVPGDQDQVQNLKNLLEKDMTMTSIQDPNAYASVLKLWFRCLPTPLIPDSLYSSCIEYNENYDVVKSIFRRIDHCNWHLIAYLVKFLKMFLVDDAIEHTKMNLSNIVMVWAPNFLRCPSDNPLEILKYNKKESDFLKFLLEKYDFNKKDLQLEINI